MTISSQHRSRAPRAPFRRVALLGALLLVPAWGCGGCGDSEPEPTPPPAPESKVPSPPPTGGPLGQAAPAPAPGELPEGIEAGEAGSLPEGFPEDLPTYPEARPTQWTSGKGVGSLVVFESSDEPSAIYEFFTAELPGAAWALQDQTVSAVRGSVVGAKEGRTARISIAASPDGGGAEFGIAVAGGG